MIQFPAKPAAFRSRYEMPEIRRVYQADVLRRKLEDPQKRRHEWPARKRWLAKAIEQIKADAVCS